MNAVGYLRRSSRVNADPGMSWDLQENAVRTLAARYGVDDLELLWDWGRSGGEGKAHLRPGWNDLHRRLETGKVGMVFGYAADRMARSLVDLLSFYRACDGAGAKVIYHDGGEQDFRSPEGKLRLEIMGSIGAFQRNQTVAKMKEMHRIRRERGERVGRAPYGTRDGDRADLVIETFKTVGSFNGTALELNRMAVPSALGRLWRAQVVRDVVARFAPELLPRTAMRGRRATSRGGFKFYHLVQDSRGHVLTAAHNRKRVFYHCQTAESDPSHPRPHSVGELRILAWAKGEASRLKIPADLVEMHARSEAERAGLDVARERVIDMYADGTIRDKADRDRRLGAIEASRASLDAARVLVEIPPLDWNAEPKIVNGVLAALWDHIELDDAMQPIRAEWLVPEWRA